MAGLSWQNFGPYKLYEDEGFPYAMDIACVSHVLDGLALIPQIFALTKGVEGSAANLHPCISHFVGILSLGRFFRMVSWCLHLVFIFQLVWGTGRRLKAGVLERILLFAVPDVFHTIMMGDFLYVWCKKVKEQTLDPWFHKINMII